ncbi:hypothetical protein [Rhodococcus sp. X156]|uniref:hypothetical protein n=1 Tax=Rhodococcus sp. X156 TaxID=2499145 RepID=UPI000FDB31B0|nr:hypothetical protein [Rhodococcus sp. X156]
MATIVLSDSILRVRLNVGEHVGGLLRNLQVPASSVRDVELVPNGLKALRGLRAPGLGLPGLRAIGTWRHKGERTMVSVRRGQPAVRVRLSGQRFDTLLIGMDDAELVADALRARLGVRL